jgi:hypothetical protein
MNPPKRDMTSDDDRRFDLLVDGELSPPERRDLLANLDDEPGGWRRCALAFLEAQAWREDLGALRQEATVSDSSTSVSSSQGHHWLFRTSGTLSAMAASFLVAMALGWWIYGRGDSGDVAPGVPVEVAEEVLPPVAPAIEPAPQLVREEPGEVRQPGMMPDERADHWRWVTLTPEQGIPDGTQPVRLPAVEADAVDEAWLQSLPAGVPGEVLDALRQAGHRVRHHRQIVPFPLEDGRSLLVPVDEVDVRYVGNKLYQ